jgi:type 1 fimbria pilin
MKRVLLIGLAAASLSAAQAAKTQTFVGTITDSMCEKADHSRMQMGPTDADCVKACVAAHGATYVLWDGKNVYELSDQKTPEQFAAKKVTVTGTLDPKTHKIAVRSMTAAK